MAPPTHDDAVLLVQLAQWGTSLGIEDNLAELFSDEFDPEAADPVKDRAVRNALFYGESIGTLTKHNILSRELVADWMWVEGLWSRVGPAAIKLREKLGEPRLYENFEALATQ